MMSQYRYPIRRQLSLSALGLVLLAGVACGATEQPMVHFTPPQNWMNDPNGMVYHDGEYHLFYQHNPFGNKWGHMSWGHAVSRDLVTWEHLPVALPEEDGVMIFSGSAVVDKENTAGFANDGETALVAIYTGHEASRKVQQQSIAYSTDNGRTWTKYAGNPVLDIGKEHFRDPKVFWYEPDEHWIMVVALSHDRKVRFYSSPNLKDWSLLSDFGPAGAVKGIWECPDLFPLEAPDGSTKWVLQVDLGGNSVAGGSGAQYFTGQFDGKRFIADPLTKPETSGGSGTSSKNRILASFEGQDFEGWKTNGTAFGTAPVTGAIKRQNPVKGFEGTGFVNGFHNGDAGVGTLKSPTFVIDRDFLNFKIGGGRDLKRLSVALLVEGRTVEKATGKKSERLEWVSWDLRSHAGKEARIVVTDSSRDGWGHLSVDHFVLSDRSRNEPVEVANWVDYGKDFYAAVTWSNAPDDRTLWIGWMSNWQYANKTPTEGWRSAMSIPREVYLAEIDGEVRLAQRPVPELARYMGDPIDHSGAELDIESKRLEAGGSDAFHVAVRLRPGTGPAGIRLLTRGDEGVDIAFDPKRSELYVDRRGEGVDHFHPKFAGLHSMPVAMDAGTVAFSMIVDRCSVEVFAEQGTRCITDLLFPPPSGNLIAIFGDGARFEELVITPINLPAP